MVAFLNQLYEMMLGWDSRTQWIPNDNSNQNSNTPWRADQASNGYYISNDASAKLISYLFVYFTTNYVWVL